MLRGAGRWLPVCCVMMLSQNVFAASNLSVFLRNFYTDYEVVKQCSGQAQLTAADAEAAKAAIAKIETHYLQREASLDKNRLLKEAVANKDAGLKMVNGSRKVDLRQYCRVTLNELVTKGQEIDVNTPAK